MKMKKEAVEKVSKKSSSSIRNSFEGRGKFNILWIDLSAERT